MSGGLLQLVAVGIEDIYLTNSPDISFFKTVYRRYTNFSIEDINIKLQGRSGFGLKSYCKIPKICDLIGAITLVADLPDIQVEYSQTIPASIRVLFDSYGIPAPGFPDSDYTYANLVNYVFNYYSTDIYLSDVLPNVITDINTYTEEATKILRPDQVVDYRNGLYEELINIETPTQIPPTEDYQVYEYLKSKLDVGVPGKPLTLSTATQILDFIIDGVNTNLVVNNDLKFYKLLEFTTFQTTLGKDNTLTAVFYNSIAPQITDDEKKTDAFKQYYSYITTADQKNFNINVTKSILLSGIIDDYYCNQLLIRNALNTLSVHDKNSVSMRIISQPPYYPTFSATEYIVNTGLWDTFYAKFFIDVTVSPQMYYLYKVLVQNALDAYQNNMTALMSGIGNSGYLIMQFDEETVPLEFWEIPPFFANHYFNGLIITFVTSVKNQLDLHGALGAHGGDFATFCTNLKSNIMNEIFSPAMQTFIHDNYITYVYAFYINWTNMQYSTTYKVVELMETEIKSYGLPPADETLTLTTLHAIGDIPSSWNITNIDEFMANYVDSINGYDEFKTPALPDEIYHKETDTIHFIEYVMNLNHLQLYKNIILNTALITSTVGGYTGNTLTGVYGIIGANPDFFNLDPALITAAVNYISTRTADITSFFEYYNLNKQLFSILSVITFYRELNIGTFDDIISNDKKTGIVDIIMSYHETSFDINIVLDIIATMNDLTILDIEDFLPADSGGLIVYGELPIATIYNDFVSMGSHYNNFRNFNDYMRYRMNYITGNNFYTKYIVVNYAENIQTDYHNILEIYNNLLATSNANKAIAVKLIDGGEIAAILNRTTYGSFAWIHRIGHFLFNNVLLEIDGQQFDKITGDWTNINYELTKDVNQTGYLRMIGELPDLYTYNKLPKPKTRLYVPLPFWSTKYKGAILPLVAMLNNEIMFHVDFRKITDVSYAESGTRYVSSTTNDNNPKLEASIMARCIYLDLDERRRITTRKNELLVEQLQYDDRITIDKLNCPVNSDNFFETELTFAHPCKYLVWTSQYNTRITGSGQTNGQISLDNYGTNSDGSGYILSSSLLRFNDRDRILEMPSMYYNHVQPFQCEFSTPATGINLYSFALFPRDRQPSGSVNLSRIDKISLRVKLNSAVISLITSGQITVHMGIYCVNYNVLRVMGGQSGLAFFK